jgi:hypothetical protein
LQLLRERQLFAVGADRFIHTDGLQVIDWVTPVAGRLRGSTEYTGDLAVPIEREDEFRELLARPLLAYHLSGLP